MKLNYLLLYLFISHEYVSGEIKWVSEGEVCTPPIHVLGIALSHTETMFDFPLKDLLDPPPEEQLYCQGNDLCTYHLLSLESTCMLIFPYGTSCKTDEDCDVNLDLDTKKNYLSMKCQHNVCTSDGLICKKPGENCEETPCCPGFFCEHPREITEWVFSGTNGDDKKKLLFSKEKLHIQKNKNLDLLSKSNNVYKNLSQKPHFLEVLPNSHHKSPIQSLYPKPSKPINHLKHTILSSKFKTNKSYLNSKEGKKDKVCVDKKKIYVAVTKKEAERKNPPVPASPDMNGPNGGSNPSKSKPKKDENPKPNPKEEQNPNPDQNDSDRASSQRNPNSSNSDSKGKSETEFLSSNSNSKGKGKNKNQKGKAKVKGKKGKGKTKGNHSKGKGFTKGLNQNQNQMKGKEF